MMIIKINWIQFRKQNRGKYNKKKIKENNKNWINTLVQTNESVKEINFQFFILCIKEKQSHNLWKKNPWFSQQKEKYKNRRRKEILNIN